MKKFIMELSAKTRDGFRITDPDELRAIALSVECHLNSAGIFHYFTSNEERSKDEPREAFVRVHINENEDEES